MNNYETVFILTPVLSEDQAKNAVSKFRKILKDSGANIIHEEAWGLKQPAAKLRKVLQDLEANIAGEGRVGTNKSTGYYQLFEFQADGKAVSELELAYKRDERVLRYLTIRLDK